MELRLIIPEIKEANYSNSKKSKLCIEYVPYPNVTCLSVNRLHTIPTKLKNQEAFLLLLFTFTFRLVEE